MSILSLVSTIVLCLQQFFSYHLLDFRCFRRLFKSVFRWPKEASGGPLVKAREKLRVAAPLWPWTATWTEKQNRYRRQVDFLWFLAQGSPSYTFVSNNYKNWNTSNVSLTERSNGERNWQGVWRSWEIPKIHAKIYCGKIKRNGKSMYSCGHNMKLTLKKNDRGRGLHLCGSG